VFVAPKNEKTLLTTIVVDDNLRGNNSLWNCYFMILIAKNLWFWKLSMISRKKLSRFADLRFHFKAYTFAKMTKNCEKRENFCP